MNIILNTPATFIDQESVIYQEVELVSIDTNETTKKIIAYVKLINTDGDIDTIVSHHSITLYSAAAFDAIIATYTHAQGKTKLGQILNP